MALIQSYATLTGADRSDDIEPAEARNGFVHLVALFLTKAGDGIIDPKLVLTWALNALGAPGIFIGLLVPIREAGALLPQLLLAQRVQKTQRRRLFWSVGSALQGLAALGIAAALATLSGATAGYVVIGLLAVFALARAICSVSYKDVLARSIGKTRRGAVTGAAASAASALVLAFAAALATGFLPLKPMTIAIAIAAGGGGWLLAALVFTSLSEEGDGSAPGEKPTDLVAPLYRDAQLRRFIAARALLVSTALAPPYLILASSAASDDALGSLGPMMIASALASILSSWVWGRLSDRSSRLTLSGSGAIGGVVYVAAALTVFLTGGLFGVIGVALAIFAAQIAYEGVRSGRKLHLTDMADDSERARYTALSNTLIGGVLVLGGVFGLLSDVAGPAVVLVVLGILAAASVPVALGLDEVQSE